MFLPSAPTAWAREAAASGLLSVSVPLGVLLAAIILALLVLVVGYAWWYHAGMPMGLSATRDEALDDMRALRVRFARAWRRLRDRR